MAVVVLSRIGHELSRKVIGSTLAGDGLLVRLRSTSIGLIGLVAATCLAMVAFVANQGWPGALNSPMPASPPTVAAVHDAVALNGPVPIALAESTHRERAGASGPGRHPGRRASEAPPGSARGKGGLHGAHQVVGPSPAPPTSPTVVATPPPAEPVPATQPSAPPASAPGQGAESAHAPTPASTAPAPVVSASGKSKSPSHSHSGAKPAQIHHAPPPPPAERVAEETAPPGDGAAEEPHGNGHAYGKSGKSEH